MTAARVAKHRSNAKSAGVFRYHLRGWDGRSLCGRDMTGKSMADFLNDCQHDGETAVVCKACANSRVKRLAGGDDK